MPGKESGVGERVGIDSVMDAVGLAAGGRGVRVGGVAQPVNSAASNAIVKKLIQLIFSSPNHPFFTCPAVNRDK